MAFFLAGFPRPVLVVDGALTVLDYSRRSLALFGLREVEGEGEISSPGRSPTPRNSETIWHWRRRGC